LEVCKMSHKLPSRFHKADFSNPEARLSYLNG
jgi:hypothetical protein